ncbi:M28 family peptidase [Aurantiacibacter luteus]|uniref:Peptidase M28 domain-containing protein n=1 Tax=Aurantiacibacter luteus TaxID=1581420 RepID=A0A0G9MX83_9SPHN|nr:M28 family peptidase [Aurantiacibacter luteus]KLE35164.1 hypothetical protein AAW00_01385 [Aurantiacibacter luteus]
MIRFACLLLSTSLPLALAAPAAAQVDVDTAMLERDVTILSADDMEGREAGTRGHERAAGYVAGRMAAMGLEPAGDDGTYFQRVPLLSYRLAETGNSLAIEGMDPLIFAQDYVSSGGPRYQTANFTAPLVFVGYGLDMPGRNDFEGVDLNGAIAVRVGGLPDGINPEEAAYLNYTAGKRVSDRGAVGMLMLATPEMTARYPWEMATRGYAAERVMTWVEADGTGRTQSPNFRVGGMLSEDAARRLFAGQDFDFDDIAAAEATPEGRMPSFALGRTATVEVASTYERIDSPNVVGMIRGSDPALAGEYVVLTAHLDHVGIIPTEEEGDDEIYNGALDNAVGVASLLEVARLLAADPPRRSVLVIAVTAEEKGLIGSSYNATHPTVPRDAIVANVNLDMPIATYDFTDVVARGAEHSTLNAAIDAAAREYGLTLSPDPTPEQGFFARSDQFSYVREGVPAVAVSPGFADGGMEAQMAVFEAHYHQASDQVGLVSFPAIGKFAGVNYLIARNVATMAERPAWNPGDFFGETYAARTPN